MHADCTLAVQHHADCSCWIDRRSWSSFKHWFMMILWERQKKLMWMHAHSWNASNKSWAQGLGQGLGAMHAHARHFDCFHQKVIQLTSYVARQHSTSVCRFTTEVIKQWTINTYFSTTKCTAICRSAKEREGSNKKVFIISMCLLAAYTVLVPGS